MDSKSGMTQKEAHPKVQQTGAKHKQRWIRHFNAVSGNLCTFNGAPSGAIPITFTIYSIIVDDISHHVTYVFHGTKTQPT